MAQDIVKVPFYREPGGSKTLFLPDCRMTKGYEIGARNEDKERGIQSYWEALDKLVKMPQPRFRRKNKKGVFGTVTCQSADFADVERSFIESERERYGG